MDNLTKQQRRKNMQNIRSVGTKPELIIVKGLRKWKMKFSRNVTNILGKPDIVFLKK